MRGHDDRNTQLARWMPWRLCQRAVPGHAGPAWLRLQQEPQGQLLRYAVAERFFLNLKMERVWQRPYANHAEAKADITGYIVGF